MFVILVDVKIVPRYHCGDEMDLIRKNENEWIYICKICEEPEYSTDPTKPTTPEEIPRRSMLEYGTMTTMDKKLYKA